MTIKLASSHIIISNIYIYNNKYVFIWLIITMVSKLPSSLRQMQVSGINAASSTTTLYSPAVHFKHSMTDEVDTFLPWKDSLDRDDKSRSCVSGIEDIHEAITDKCEWTLAAADQLQDLRQTKNEHQRNIYSPNVQLLMFALQPLETFASLEQFPTPAMENLAERGPPDRWLEQYKTTSCVANVSHSLLV